MIGLDRKKATKINSKARIFCLILAVVFILSQANRVAVVNAAEKIYVDKVTGGNANSGTSPKNAVKTLQKARELLKGEGVIYVKIGDQWIKLGTKTVAKDKKNEDIAEKKATDKVSTVAEEVSKVVAKPTSKEISIPEATEDELATKPEVEAKVTPKITPEATPEVTPEVSSEAKPEVKPEVEPEVNLEATQKDGESISIIEDGKEATPGANTGTDKDENKDVKKEVPSVTDEAKTAQTDEMDTIKADEANPIAEGDIAEMTTDDKETFNETEGSETQAIEEKVIPEETQEQIADLTKLVGRMTFMVEGQSDIDNVGEATKAYEELDDEAKSKLPNGVYKRLRAAQIVANSLTRAAFNPYEVVGNTGDVYNQSGTQGAGGSTSSGSASNGGTSSGNNSGNTDKSTGNQKTTVAPRSVGAKTGDSNRILMTAGVGTLAGAVGGAMIGLMLFKKKKKKQLEEVQDGRE